MRSKRRRKVQIKENIEFIGLCIPIYQVLNRLWGNEMPWRFFSKAVTLLLFVMIFIIYNIGVQIYQEVKKYVKKRIDLYNKANLDENERSGYALGKEKLLREFLKLCKAAIVKKGKRFPGFFVVVFLMFFVNPQNAKAYLNDIKEVVGIEVPDMVNENIANEESGTLKPDDEDDEVGELESLEEVKTERNMEWRFVLCDAERNPELEYERESQVFFYSSDSSLDKKALVDGIITQWEKEKEQGVDYFAVRDEDGNSFYTYTDSEDAFLLNVKSASRCVYYEDWVTCAPLSLRLDDYIEGREKLNKVIVDGESGCYEIWWHLANDYLYYAEEYQKQTENADAILYYYVNSTYACMEALKYCANEDQYRLVFHFLVMRYHDMIDNKCLISTEYKDKAEEIYDILVEMDEKN